MPSACPVYECAVGTSALKSYLATECVVVVRAAGAPDTGGWTSQLRGNSQRSPHHLSRAWGLLSFALRCIYAPSLLATYAL